MSAIRLYLATTEGPAEVQRITPEDTGVRSVVCLDGKAVALPISSDYDAFVRAPTGVVETCFGHSAYRVDVSQPVSDGLSWQLGVFVAHALFAAGALATREQAPRRAVWLTGEVDRALEIRPVTDVARKIAQSRRLITELCAAGMPLTLYVPRANRDALDDVLLSVCPDGAACRLVAVDTVADVLADLRLPSVTSTGPRFGEARPRRRGWRYLVPTAACALIALLGGGLAWSAIEREASGVALSVGAVQQRPPAGASCAAVHFRTVRPVIQHDEFRIGTAPVPIKAGGLCDLRYRVVNRGARAVAIAVIGSRRDTGSETVRTRVLLDDVTLAPGAQVEIDARPPQRLNGTLVQHAVFAAVPADADDRRRALRRHLGTIRDRTDPLGWDTWRRDMIATVHPTALDAVQAFRP